MAWTGLNYNAPNSELSSIDNNKGHNDSEQLSTFKWLRKAIIHSRKEQYFMSLSSVENMPKHMGKTIKVYEYVPLLDDRNINDMGIDANGVTIANGNLYGSSKDIGTIEGKLPFLREEGGRVNRVGFSRIVREGSLHRMGFFTEFTREALDFDSDDQLKDHLSRELMDGAVEMTEAVLQKDLLSGAGTVYYAGAAATTGEISGEEGAGGEPVAVVTYDDFVRLDQILNDNRTPKSTKIITGSLFTDTKTISGGRVMYVGSEIVPHLKNMKDNFGNPAFIPVQKYADAGNLMTGEIGAIDSFRIVQVPEMLHWAGGKDSSGNLLGGAEVVTDDNGFRTTHTPDGEFFNVYPMLVVGDDSFVNIGFQTDGKSVKFNVITKMPGRETADYNDPFGQTGFSSIMWYYGILIKRPERIAVLKTVAPI